MKSLPKNPNLEFLKKEAKSLRALHKKGDVSCCDLIRQCDTSFKTKTDNEILGAKFSINDAQRMVAREYGYSSWATLKHYIESLDLPLYHGVSDKQAYHKTITDSYDERSSIYDDYVSAKETSIQLVDFQPPQSGDKVLDIATGTGTIAFYISDIIGADGFVTGIDISTGMLKKCNEKLKNSGLHNLQFEYGDGENLNYPPNSFDLIYCNAGLYWMINPQAALRHWFELLKPSGKLVFSAWPSNSFLWGNGVRQVLRKQGVDFTIHEFSGNKEKTNALLELAGFSNIKIDEVNSGHYISVEDAKESIADVLYYTPGQYPHPLSNIPEETLLLAQKDYDAEVDKRVTDKGVWHDMKMYYVSVQKF